MKNRTIEKFLLIGLLGICLSVVGSPQKIEDPGVLLRSAIEKEEVDGDLQGAIELYKKIIEKFGDNAAVAAQAQLRIGLCYEKLGSKASQQALEAFQKVVENYPDQTEAVQRAIEKLSLLQRAKEIVEEGDSGFKISEIPIDPEKNMFSFISPDGKKMAFASGRGDIFVTDIASGEEIQLTQTPEFDFMCYWSPDSQKIAYLDATNNIYVVSAQGGSSKILFEINDDSKKEYGICWPTGWSPDSQYLNCWIEKKGLVGIPISGGEWRDIYSFTSPDQYERDYAPGTLPSLSPDEKFIAFNPNSENRDIFIKPTKGGEAVQITDHPAKDSLGLVAWSYDSRWLRFGSDRNGKDEGWIIGISPDGKPEGEPFQVPFLSTEGVGAMDVCWTLDNRIGFSHGSATNSIFVSNVDGSEEVKLTDFGFWPKWSPDSQNIAFISSRGGQENVWILPVQGGEAKNISAMLTARPEVSFTRGINWHPNGRKVSCWTLVGQNRECWTMDIQSGDAQKIPFDYDGYPVCLDWSPDGTKIAFCYSNTKTPNTIKDSEAVRNIYTVPAEGGEATRLTRMKEIDLDFSWPNWSPDGTQIAFRDSKGRIWVVSSEKGEPQLIMEKGIAGRGWINWSPDGKTIYFWGQEKPTGNEDLTTIFCSVSSQGGEPKILYRAEATGIDLSPDGKKIAYRKITNNIKQFWLLENFLPEKK
jgi:Tol biopolymer transport system component